MFTLLLQSAFIHIPGRIDLPNLPSLPGVTPPTMLVPYSKLSLAFPVATRPVNPYGEEC
jgi:hypothetical protein